MERKKRSKGRGWESCYVKKIYGTFGVEMRAYGQKLVKFCTHTHTHTHAAKLVVEIYWLLDDLSQITFVLDDMSQKGAICSKIIWTICHNFV